MNRKLVLIVLLILTSVCSVSSTDDGDDNDRNDTTKSPQGEDDENDNSSTIADSTTSVSFSSDDYDEDVVKDEEDEYDHKVYKTKRWIRTFVFMIGIAWEQYFPNSNDTVKEEIGPKLRVGQLCGLLKQDLKEAYQKKCTKLSGDENAYAELSSAKDELKNSLVMWLKYQYETIKNATKAKDFKLVATTFCQKRDELFGYVNDFRMLKDRCSFPREIKRENHIRDILKAISDSVCSNGGTDLASLVSRDGEGRKCVMINKDEILTCGNKALYAFLKRVVKKFIENEYFEFKMDKDDCDEFDAVSECFVSSVENCVDPIAKNQFTSIFTIFREQTNCATIT
ncbi:uncharacterized protein LOC119078260 isoform X2 [Bradysia coprophila]|uniref:uncharacterized protein LOC119078260 isoform X2 n=1 Tax=Bradysia coprophila TaxID=38358 RepID=UPI00187D90BF|nr:uncharacterized protein LOC119078260 isoform X2 [Bradysia coprophila]